MRSNLCHAGEACPLNRVSHASGHITAATARDIGTAAQAKGSTLSCVSSHSPRAGGAMALKLSGASDSTIMRVGHETSLTYLTYIHTQIGALTPGVAWNMSTAFTFQNVGSGSSPSGNLLDTLR